jgi:hypothetical protein
VLHTRSHALPNNCATFHAQRPPEHISCDRSDDKRRVFHDHILKCLHALLLSNENDNLDQIISATVSEIKVKAETRELKFPYDGIQCKMTQVQDRMRNGLQLGETTTTGELEYLSHIHDEKCRLCGLVLLKSAKVKSVPNSRKNKWAEIKTCSLADPKQFEQRRPCNLREYFSILAMEPKFVMFDGSGYCVECPEIAKLQKSFSDCLSDIMSEWASRIAKLSPSEREALQHHLECELSAQDK